MAVAHCGDKDTGRYAFYMIIFITISLLWTEPRNSVKKKNMAISEDSFNYDILCMTSRIVKPE